MILSSQHRAERAGRAAKTTQGRRRERERVVWWSTAVLLGIPLLFVAVWFRMQVSNELRLRDDLVAERGRLTRAVGELTGERTRLSTWASIGGRARGIGLRPPRTSEVLWVRVGNERGG
jgi:hypothetical protein